MAPGGTGLLSSVGWTESGRVVTREIMSRVQGWVAMLVLAVGRRAFVAG